MAWVELRQSVYGHRKTRRAARRLGIRCAHLVGHLGALWTWALDNALGGELGGVEVEILAEVMEWQGDADLLVATLVEVGYLDRHEGGLRIHNWERYIEHYLVWLDQRKRHAEAQSAYKARRRLALAGGDISGDRQVISPVISGDRLTDRTNQTGPNEPLIPPGPPAGGGAPRRRRRRQGEPGETAEDFLGGKYGHLIKR